MRENKMADELPDSAKLIEDLINGLIDERLKDHETSIKEEDAKEIVEYLMPELEKVVSKIVLKHLKAIAAYVQTKLKED
jgi:hypothetical protein